VPGERRIPGEQRIERGGEPGWRRRDAQLLADRNGRDQKADQIGAFRIGLGEQVVEQGQRARPVAAFEVDTDCVKVRLDHELPAEQFDFFGQRARFGIAGVHHQRVLQLRAELFQLFLAGSRPHTFVDPRDDLVAHALERLAILRQRLAQLGDGAEAALRIGMHGAGQNRLQARGNAIGVGAKVDEERVAPIVGFGAETQTAGEDEIE